MNIRIPNALLSLGLTAVIKSLKTKRILSSLLVCCYLTTAIAQRGSNDKKQLIQSTHRTVEFNIEKIASLLFTAPMELTEEAKTKAVRFTLPLPNSGEVSFAFVESPILAPDLAARFPAYKTYAFYDPNDPIVTGRLSITPMGLNAIIFLKTGIAYIRPLDVKNPVKHEVFMGGEDEVKDIADVAVCHGAEGLTPDNRTIPNISPRSLNSVSNGTTQRTYRMAIVTTGEYTAANGGTVASVTAALTPLVNSLNAIYMRELAVRFTLLTPFAYTDPTTDNLDPTAATVSLATQAGTAVTANFNSADYDIGHVIHQGGGGQARLGAVCGSGKAVGWSGSSIGVFAHEVGHMFNMPHTFNGTGSNCTSNISNTSSYEIGSGNSIMSYNGLCQTDNNIPSGGTADHYFHAQSLERAINYMNSVSCGTSMSSGNTPPVVTVNSCGGSSTIPIGTPFTLSGSATDANSDALFYSWEQYDEDGSGSVATQGFIGATAAASTIAPLFRSYPPTTSASRTFPTMSLVSANNYASSFEPLPTVARTLNFRLTARDYNAGGGGTHCAALAVTVDGSGPFTVNAPNGGETIAAGSSTTVMWSTNTTSFCTNVNIKLSTDGGLTYPYTLASNVSNATGSQSVTIPAGVTNTTQARIRVERADNPCIVFFDISNANFTITSSCAAVASNICNTADVTANAGDVATNLSSPLINFGSATSSISLTPSGSVSTPINSTPAASGAGTCTSLNFGHGFQTFRFRVSQTGNYTFSHPGGVFRVLSVHQTAAYNSAAACSNNYIGSNAYSTGGGSASASGSVTLSLTACTDYVLVLYAASGTAVTVTMTSSAGTIFANSPPSSADYSYTYVAVYTATNLIAAVSSTANFTTLGGGVYNVYGASYYSGAGPTPTTVNPSTWVGQTTSAILSGGACALFSENFKKLTITATCTAPSVPTINTDAATCSAASSHTISNYNAANTYTFTPTGPSVGAGGVISGVTVGTAYTVTASNGGCTSTASAAFTPAAILATPAIPTINTTAATCSAPSSHSISNYNAANTYTFTPTDPSVGAGGVITGAAVGTAYTITASNGGCTSTASAAFTPAAMLATPAIPTISTTAATCSAPSSHSISNYNAANTYTFTPAGPSVGAGGVITGAVVGTAYTITASNGGCTSTASAAFTPAATLATPAIPTINTTTVTCSAPSSHSISNYNAANTYTFTPTGPSVGAGGVITGAAVGTAYTITASNGGCTSTASAAFTPAAILATPAIPTINTTTATCSAPSSHSISNYNAANTYTFTPTGPSVGVGGVITGAAVGTAYTVTASNGGCTSTASAAFTPAAILTVQPAPTINTTAATCSAPSSHSISNYNAANTYTFTPTGPSVGAGGVITGAAVGTAYTVTASNGGCTSTASAAFTPAAMLATPAIPTISTTAATCSAPSSHSISNYNAANTYTFTPTGPSVGVGGVITGAAVSTAYTVTASNGGCTSTTSAAFTPAAMLATPAIPTINTTAATCSAPSSHTISNYNAANTYTFTPTGPSVGVGGVITGAAVGTAYTVTASNGGCTSTASAAFTPAATLTVQPAPTINTAAATCSAPSSHSISNYNAANTYTFTPTGPSVGAGGVITGAAAGTAYTVTASNGGCTSTASAAFTPAATLTVQPAPTINTTAATCSAPSSHTISNYNAANTYTFTPTGPSVGVGGVITGAAAGTAYTVTASNGGCTSTASAAFTPDATLTVQPAPTISTDAATCSAASSHTISNYNAANTYTFTPTGPSVGAGGVISDVTVGTVYSVTASNGGCISTASASFTPAAMLTTPAIPTINTTAATCSAASSHSISNYNAANTYTFTPTGPTVSAGGVITGAAVGTAHTVTASNGGCISTASASFTPAAILTTPAVPTIRTDAATCIAASSHTITNYSSANTYTFTPAGPSVSTVGVISGAVVGTVYTVTASTIGCTSSSPSTSFTPAAVVSGSIVSILGGNPICVGTTTTLSPTTGGTWTSSNSSVATVTDAGGVTGISAGTARFTFTQTSTGCQSTTPLVTVGDAEKPTITCPPSQTIALGSFECGRVVVFADPSVSDNCSAPTFERTDALKTAYKSGSSFGAGTYPLSYRATDGAGNFADCNFTIQVNGQLTSGRLTCIPTLTVALDERQCTNTIDAVGLLIDNIYYCTSSYSTSIAGRTNANLSSADIGKTFTVTVRDNSNNNCSTVVTVVDTKAPVLNAPLDAAISCTDVSRDGRILATLSQPTIISECGRTTFTTQDRVINLPTGQTSFNTRPDGFPADKNFSPTSAFNANRIIVRTYTATDESNNTSSVQQVIYVKNIELSQVQCPKDVTLSCTQSGFNTDIQSTGTPFVNNGRLTQDVSCGIDYIYSDERTNTSQGYTIKRTWTLIARSNNQSQMCTQTITVNCANTPLLAISGNINKETGENVPATVKVFQSNTEMMDMQGSSYLFSQLQTGNSYRIQPERDNDVMNGVTTFDITLLSKHISEIQPFTSPYQMIAGDVNRDGNLDASDMVLIRNLILRRITRFPSNTAWRFIPKSFVFADNKNPFADDFPEVLNYTNLSSNMDKADFVAVKVGDVNLNARAANVLSLATRTARPTENIYLMDKKMEEGKEYIFDVNIKNSTLKALQMALRIDKSNVASFSVEAGDLPQFETGNFEVNQEQGIVGMAWANTSKSKVLDENNIIQLRITPRQSAWLHELVSLDEQNMENLVYDTEGGIEKQIQLKFNTLKTENPEFDLHQNRPNPFTTETTISFSLPETNNATLSIYDVNGREVYTLKQAFNKGYNEVKLNNTVLKNTGIYFYRLQSDKFTAVKRLQYFVN